MYKVVVKKAGKLERILLAENYRELKDIINLSPEAKYEIISVEKFDIVSAKDYLKKIRKEIYTKNTNLVFGNKK